MTGNLERPRCMAVRDLGMIVCSSSLVDEEPVSDMSGKADASSRHPAERSVLVLDGLRDPWTKA